jgi:hypothetical protein
MYSLTILGGHGKEGNPERLELTLRRDRLFHLSAWNEGLIPAGKDPLG